MLDLVKQDAGPLWLADGLAKLAEQQRQDELEQKRKADRAFSNLVESLREILGDKAAEEIIRAGEPGSEVGSIQHDRFMFVGRADACGLGFYIQVPGYALGGSYSRHDCLSSDWISNISEVPRAVKWLLGEMKRQDEKEAEQLQKRAELDAMMTVKTPVELSAQDRSLVYHLRQIADGIEGGHMLGDFDQAIIYSMRALSSISDLILSGPSDNDNYEENEDR